MPRQRETRAAKKNNITYVCFDRYVYGIFHDDDEIHENEFTKILQGNITYEYDFICSTLKGKNPDFSDHDSKSKTGKINNIIKTFFS